MSSNQDYSRKILKILAENKALSLPDLGKKMAPDGEALPTKARYALNRTLKNLRESGMIESHFSGQNDYARLTSAGRRRAITHRLEAGSSLLAHWDGKWRIVLLDLPEARKNERESLRYLLKKAGFVCLKNSAWISPHPFEHLFMNIKRDLGLTTELVIMVTSTLDEETERALVEGFLQGERPA